MIRAHALAIVAVLVAGTAPLPARAERPVHGSVGGGSSLLLTGDGGDRLRYDLEADVEPGSRYGGAIAWRGFARGHHGIVTAGLVYEAGAARPLLVLDLHADVGVDLDQRAPAVGGGVRTTLTIAGPIGVALDSTGYLVIDGVDRTRLALAGGAMLVARW